MSARVVDLFAGPGGWSEGLRSLGLSDIGIEHDAAACATRRAAGHLTIRADVSQYPPEVFAPCWGLIASPPCTAFSLAGKGAGTAVIDELLDAIRVQDWSACREHAPTVWLPLELGRWVDALRPEWLACEQVPPALPLWEAYVPWLRSLGYNAWCGVLNAADYGVPQTRQRAFLMASRVRSVAPPPATHARDPHPTLFGADAAPWVSMAEALGWGMTERPMVTIAPGHNDAACVGGSGARAAVERERERFVVVTRGNSGREQDEFDASSPSRTLTGKSDSWVVDRRTVSRGARGGRVPTAVVPMSEPAPTLTSQSPSQWCLTRPATTIVGSFCPDIVAAPGYPVTGSRQNAEGSIKITEQDALTLQSFDPGYPLQGSRSKRFEQVGNAVPPLLAQHVIAAVTGLEAM